MRKAAEGESKYCGADPQTIHEYERGRIPHPDPLRWLAVALGLPVEQLAMAARQQRQNRRRQNRLAMGDWPRDSTEDDVADRRQFGKLSGTGFAAMAAAPVLETLERIAHALDRPSRIDERLLDALHEHATRLGEAYHGLPAESLITPTREHLEAVVRLMRFSMTDSQRRRLCGIAADVAALAGWIYLLLDGHADAQACLALARSLAHESEHPTLEAVVFGSMSRASSPTLTSRGGDPSAALALVERASGLAERTPALVRSWLGERTAIEYACAGYSGASDRTLEDARCTLAKSTGESSLGGFLGRLLTMQDQWYLTTVEGLCHVQLGRGERAEGVLLSALDDASPVRRRLPIMLLADLAAAYILQDAPEAATRALAEARVLAAQCGFSVGLQRIRNVRSRMPLAWAGLGCVRDLDERLAL
ncbi:MAG: hypothetical protein ACRDJG_05780 [Actinomycetota bacterium]